MQEKLYKITRIYYVDQALESREISPLRFAKLIPCLYMYNLLELQEINSLPPDWLYEDLEDGIYLHIIPNDKYTGFYGIIVIDNQVLSDGFWKKYGQLDEVIEQIMKKCEKITFRKIHQYLSSDSVKFITKLTNVEMIDLFNKLFPSEGNTP